MRIARGDIFHARFPHIEHGKFFVVIGENHEEIIGAFFINSNIRNFLLSKPKLLNLQVGISNEEYPFLTHNSYLDCSQIIRISKTNLISDIESGAATRRGKLHEEDLNHVLELVGGSDVFSASEKEFFK